MNASPPEHSPYLIDRENFNGLFKALEKRGYRIVGPTLRDHAIVYDELHSVDDLPKGIGDEQGPATYRLKKRNDQALFGYVVGPHSWKKYVFPPSTCLFKIKRNGDGHAVTAAGDTEEKFAFLGMRSCEIAAMQIQDKVFMGGEYVDPFYEKKRKRSLIIAVNCLEPGGTCFCVSMNTGPKAQSGFDLCLTEIAEPDRHYFLLEVGSETGGEIIADIPHRPARPEEIKRRDDGLASARGKMGRSLDTAGIKELLYQNDEHPHWEDVAARCESCANCTMVCPTCFCSTVEDVTDLKGETAERHRKWDSCFTMDHSYMHGGHARSSVKSRYRQWLTHKLASWQDQFGTSGCVGCGRCITWCPVGIDLTKEVEAIRTREKEESSIA